MPLVRGDELLWIYRISPMQVARNPVNEVAEFTTANDGEAQFVGWSGSSQCIRYRDRWLCVIHRKTVAATINFEHAFVEFDDNFRIIRASGPWYFENPLVEFCAGLCFTKDSAIMSYGILDRECRILKIPLAQIEDLLNGDE